MKLPKIEELIDKKLLIEAIGLSCIGLLAVPIVYLLLRKRKKEENSETEVIENDMQICDKAGE